MPLTDAATAPDPDLLVVGAGAAGIGAATAAAAQGLSVVLLTEAGGVAPADPIAGVMVRPGETVWSVAGGFRIDTIGPQGPRHLHAAALVDASGAQDWIIPFPGWDLPGVLGLHEAERLMAAQRTPPGRRVLVAGCGDRLIDVAAAVLAVGGTVAAIVDLGATTPRGWNGVAVLHQATLGGATAEDGALQVAVRGLDGDDTVRMIVADAIAVAHAAVPSTAITRLMRAAHAYDAARGAWHPVIDHDGRTSVRCLYVAGETAAQGTRTGLAVARDLGRPPARLSAPAPLQQPRPGDDPEAALRQRLLAAMDGETVVCRCEGVRRAAIDAAAAAGAADLNQLKAWTRCGMGHCQGRFCADTAASLLAEQGIPRPRSGQFTGRTPLHPVPLAPLTGTYAYADIVLPPAAPL